MTNAPSVPPPGAPAHDKPRDPSAFPRKGQTGHRVAGAGTSTTNNRHTRRSRRPHAAASPSYPSAWRPDSTDLMGAQRGGGPGADPWMAELYASRRTGRRGNVGEVFRTGKPLINKRGGSGPAARQRAGPAVRRAGGRRHAEMTGPELAAGHPRPVPRPADHLPVRVHRGRTGPAVAAGTRHRSRGPQPPAPGS